MAAGADQLPEDLVESLLQTVDASTSWEDLREARLADQRRTAAFLGDE